MKSHATIAVSFGFATKLAAAHPAAAADENDPMPIGDLLWECKAPANIEFDDCEPVREMIKEKGAENDGYYTPDTGGCEAFETGNCRLTLCPQLHFVVAMCGLNGRRGWIQPNNGTYNLWLSESGWTGHV